MRLTILLVLPCLLLSSCGSSSGAKQFEFGGATMGTTYTVKVIAPRDSITSSELQAELQQALDSIERLASTYIEQSELSIFNNNRSTDWISVSPRLCHTVASALALSRRTDGAFDVTVGPLVNVWGFGPTGVPGQPPSDTDIAALLTQVGFEKIQSDCKRPALRKQHPQLFVDLSGWAKGFAADELAAMLVAQGLQNFLVEVGGEMRVQGSNAEGKRWAIAIEKPVSDGREVQSILRLSNTGIATSGDYRNFFDYDGQRYSHTIDPTTGKPISHNLASVTVFAKSAADADGLATAMLVLGPEQGPALAQRLGIEALFLVRTAAGFDTIRITATN